MQPMTIMPPLFLLSDPVAPIQIYGRSLAQIVGLIEYYHVREPQWRRNPNVAPTMRALPDSASIRPVNHGTFTYSLGPKRLNSPFQDLNVTEDFTVKMNSESALYFALQREQRDSLERAGLFKWQVHEGGIPFLCFIPPDIMDGICKYDLSDLLNERDEFQRKMETVPGWQLTKRVDQQPNNPQPTNSQSRAA